MTESPYTGTKLKKMDTFNFNVFLRTAPVKRADLIPQLPIC